jgi:putative ABC transport system permease protein
MEKQATVRGETGAAAAGRRSALRAGGVPVARRNLFGEKGRLAMSVAGVAFAVLLILLVVSLYRGWSAASRVLTDLPGDVWVAQAGTRDPFRSTSLLPSGLAGELGQIAGVGLAIPVYARRIGFTREGKDLDLFFMALAVPEGTPLPAETRERFLPPPGGVVVDEVLAREAGIGAGDELDVLGTRLRVTGVRAGGNPLFQLAFVNGADAPGLLRLGGSTSFYLLSAQPAASLEAVRRAAEAALPGSEASTSEEFAETTARLVNEGFLPVVGALVAIGFLIGGAVIGLTTYTATIEKARDFGVLKALGASGGFLYRIVVEQSLIVGVAGAALGVGASALAGSLIERRVPEFVTDLRPLDVLGVLAIALGVSLAAAYVPARRINRIDPAMVFRG